nr:hypothetical protein Iba_chr10aCG17630 [Ipomoea batatas]
MTATARRSLLSVAFTISLRLFGTKAALTLGTFRAALRTFLLGRIESTIKRRCALKYCRNATQVSTSGGERSLRNDPEAVSAPEEEPALTEAASCKRLSIFYTNLATSTAIAASTTVDAALEAAKIAASSSFAFSNS